MPPLVQAPAKAQSGGQATNHQGLIVSFQQLSSQVFVFHTVANGKRTTATDVQYHPRAWNSSLLKAGGYADATSIVGDTLTWAVGWDMKKGPLPGFEA